MDANAGSEVHRLLPRAVLNGSFHEARRGKQVKCEGLGHLHQLRRGAGESPLPNRQECMREAGSEMGVRRLAEPRHEPPKQLADVFAQLKEDAGDVLVVDR